MPHIHVYIDDSYWRIDGKESSSAISFLEHCLYDNRMLYSIHFNHIGGDDEYKELKATMSGMEESQISLIEELLQKLGYNRTKEEFQIESACNYDKSFFVCLPFEENRGTIIFTKNPELKCLEKELGFGIIDTESLEWLKIMPIKKKERVSDIEFTSSFQQCNSIVIVDKYVLKDKWMIEKNLIPILKKLKSNAPINQITIISQFKSRSEKPSYTLSEAYNKIVELCPHNQKWRIEIYDVGEEFHDRFIITNNNYITIGGGWDSRELLGTGMVNTKTTTMHTYLYPLFQNEIVREVIFYVSTIKDKIKNIDSTKKKSNMVKNTPNYLLTSWLKPNS